MRVLVDSFIEGMDAQYDPMKVITRKAYPILINGRVRDDVVEPINAPLLQNAPAGKKQGLYKADNFALAFIAGKAYYRDYSAVDSQYIEIEDFQMDAEVDYIYAQAIPVSISNYLRKSADGTASGAVVFTSPIGGTPAGVICQDGLNQPWFITPDGKARITLNYDEWTMENQEYVPIGTKMSYDNNTLYILNQGNGGRPGNKFLRSVSGMPMNFMIAIDANGNKLPQAIGNAEMLAHAVGFDSITCMASINSPERDLFVSTGRYSWFVRPDEQNLFFGEPRFFNIPLFSTGPVNQFSFTEMIGDSAFIDISGLRSFNAVMQVKVEGTNSPFSKQVSRFFKKIEQGEPCCIVHDNYVFFAVNTVYGPAVLVYDEQLERYVSIDIYSGIAAIKMFTEIRVNNKRRLLFITVDDLMYEAFASTRKETCGIYVGDMKAESANAELKPDKVNLVFTDVEEAGIVSATSYVNGEKIKQNKAFVKQSNTVVPQYIETPFGASDKSTTKTAMLNLQSSTRKGFRAGIYVEWAFSAKLAVFQMDTVDDANDVAQSERSTNFAGAQHGSPTITGFSPFHGIETTVVTLTGTNLLNVQRVYLDVRECQITSHTNNEVQFIIPDDAVTGQISLVFENITVVSTIDFTVV